MNNEHKALPKNKNNDNKPVQEDLPSNKQRPMGNENDLERNDRYNSEKEDNDTNSVGIRKKEEGSGSSLG